MSDYTVHTEETAPEASKPVIAGVKAKMGMLPNLMATLAESPAAVEGYATLMGIYEKSGFTHAEKEVVLMTNNRLNGCYYCMAAHTAVSKSKGVPDDVIEALRSGSTLADPKLEALRTFAIAVFENRGNVSNTDVEAFLAAGYTKANVLEIILGTALKVISNYSTKLTKPPVDVPFQRFAWSSDEAVKA